MARNIPRSITTKRTTEQVEAIAIPADGEYLFVSEQARVLIPGDQVILTASDGGVFFATVEDVSTVLGRIQALLTLS